LPSLIDPGEMSFTVNFIPSNATQIDLKDDLLARTRRNFRLVFTDSSLTTWAFAGYVTQFSVTEEIESALSAQVTIKLTSAPEEI